MIAMIAMRLVWPVLVRWKHGDHVQKMIAI
jgi:hypothetical protein